MRLVVFISIILVSLRSFGQSSDQQLAQHYYGSGDFEKALVYYEKLYDEDPSKFHFNRYYECLTVTGDDKTAEKILKKAVSRNKQDLEYPILLGKFYESIDEQSKANDIYDDLIDDLTANARDVIQLYNSFKSQGKSELSFKTLEKGRRLLKKTYPLNVQFAEYYGANGETEKMINEYLNLIDYHSSYLNSVQRIMSQQIDFEKEDSEEYELLKNALIQRTQKNPDNIYYSEMLTWLFVQRQNFPAALIHIKAMDKRSATEGLMVYDFGKICVENKDYRTAKKAFKYITDLEPQSPYLMRSQSALLNVSFLEVTTLRNFGIDDLNETINNYNIVLTEHGKSEKTLAIIIELAHIKAFYADRKSEAINLLNEALQLTRLTDMQRADVKMLLADVHVLGGDVWEASLLYMQIDKDFKYEPIGHEAKFKNARIFYYDGEFDFAQSQLDVLKQSTTKLIANDALKLSILITDNFGLDSNYTVMNWFAQADLLIEQHNYQKAFSFFDSIIQQFPEHSLGDEIQLKKAHAYKLSGKWSDAVSSLETLLKYDEDDILGDDALFQLGDIYENHLFDKAKALEYYKRLLFDHKGSLYSTEARKRFQALKKSELNSKE